MVSLLKIEKRYRGGMCKSMVLEEIVEEGGRGLEYVGFYR